VCTGMYKLPGEGPGGLPRSNQNVRDSSAVLIPASSLLYCETKAGPLGGVEFPNLRYLFKV